MTTLPFGQASTLDATLRRERQLPTALLDLNSLWFPPMEHHEVSAPFFQRARSSPSEEDRRPTPPLTEPVVEGRRGAHQGPHGDRFIVVGRWRGWVTEVLDDTFLAEVEDQQWESPPHAVELPQRLVSDFDQPLLAENAIFYWTIGYRHRPGGTRVQEAVIRFRRAPGTDPWARRLGDAWATRVRRALDED